MSTIISEPVANKPHESATGCLRQGRWIHHSCYIYTAVWRSKFSVASPIAGWYDRRRTGDLRWDPGCLFSLARPVNVLVILELVILFRSLVRVCSLSHPIYAGGIFKSFLQDVNNDGFNAFNSIPSESTTVAFRVVLVGLLFGRGCS